MFAELMPLLGERTVLITVARESDTTIRATVVPKRNSESENAALSTPLSFVGRPEELDRDFAKELAAYVDTHVQLGSTLAQAKATMEAAAKAAQEEAKRKADDKRKAKCATSVPGPAPSTQPGASASRDPEPGTTSSLFGGAPIGPVESQPPAGGGGGGGLQPVTPATRIFAYRGLTLPDPDCRLSPEDVKAAFAIQYPELTTAAINGPEVVGDKLRWEFVTAVGAKG